MVAGKGEGGKEEGGDLRLQLFLHHPAGVLCILSEHWPRAFGGAFAVGLDGVDLFIS